MIDLLLRRWHRLRQTRLPESLPLSPPGLDDPGEKMQAVLATRPALEKILRENILPFWVERSLDREYGGFLLNHGPDGEWLGPVEKASVPQSRMVWFFARAHRGGYLPDGLSLAEHGVAFLRDKLWDHERGGFFWSVGHDGRSVADPSKRLYSQCFALYGLAEYARACRDAVAGPENMAGRGPAGGPDAGDGPDPGLGQEIGNGAKSRAREAFGYAGDMAEVFRRSFHDELNGGFHSELDGAMRPAPTDGPRGEKVRHKTVNEHLHVLEAFSAYSHLGGDPWIEGQIRDLILILTGTTFRKAGGTNTDNHRSDWTPLLGPGQAYVSYGHDVEAVWLVAEGCSRLGIPFQLVADWARTLMEHTLRWGWDRKRGGVFFSGPLNGPAHTRRKIWWVQAEVLVGSLAAYRLMGDDRYADLYMDTLDWILTRHVDWEKMEWHSTVNPNGRISGQKADIWKSAYHNGRAMIQSLEFLSRREPFSP